MLGLVSFGLHHVITITKPRALLERTMAYNKPSFASKYYPTFVQQLPPLAGKTFVITGTTSGTGKIAAHTIASKGGQVIMLNRTSSRSEKPNRTSQLRTPMWMYKPSNVIYSPSHPYNLLQTSFAMVALMESTPSSTMRGLWRCQTVPSTVLTHKCKPITSLTFS